MTTQADALPKSASVGTYVERLLERAAEIRLPELFTAPPPHTLYHGADRQVRYFREWAALEPILRTMVSRLVSDSAADVNDSSP